jgi:hypothetical protein
MDWCSLGPAPTCIRNQCPNPKFEPSLEDKKTGGQKHLEKLTKEASATPALFLHRRIHADGLQLDELAEGLQHYSFLVYIRLR